MTERRSLLQFLTYAAVGAVGTLAQYAVLVTAVSLHLSRPAIASVAGAIVGAVVNYLLNARYTFRRAEGSSHGTAIPKFVATAVLAAALNGVLMFLMTEYAAVPYLLAQIITSGVVLMLTYTVNRVWTFRVA